MKPITPNVAEIMVSYRPKVKAADAPQITTSADAHNILRSAYNEDTIALQEEFVVLYLNRNNRVLGVYKASTGGITGTVADPRLILATALKVAAVAMVLSHSHPSGSLKPSRADEELTKRLVEAARYHDIKVLDHLILEPGGTYLSLADDGIM